MSSLTSQPPILTGAKPCGGGCWSTSRPLCRTWQRSAPHVIPQIPGVWRTQYLKWLAVPLDRLGLRVDS